MKYIDKLPLTANKRNAYIAGVAVTTCLIVAVIVYFGLQTLMPKKAQPSAKPVTKSQPAPEPINPLIKEADRIYESADDALKSGDEEKGIEELKKALALYEQAGDVMKAEQMKDQIAMAEFAIKAENDYQTTEAAQDKGKATKSP